MDVEELVAWELAGETEVLGDKPPPVLSTTNPTWPDLRSNPDCRFGRNSAFWDTTPCRLVEVYRRFTATCHLHFQWEDEDWEELFSELLPNYTASHPTGQYTSFCSVSCTSVSVVMTNINWSTDNALYGRPLSWNAPEAGPQVNSTSGGPIQVLAGYPDLDGVVWTGLIWLRIGTSGGPLWTR
jgi:hypothetical protein